MPATANDFPPMGHSIAHRDAERVGEGALDNDAVRP
jgi:hypothetical protein